MAKVTQKLTEEYKQAAILEFLAAKLHALEVEPTLPADEQPDGVETSRVFARNCWHRIVGTNRADNYRTRAEVLLQDLSEAGLDVNTKETKTAEGELVEALDFLLTIPATRVVELPKPYADATV